jgi:flagellar FliL protein
MADQEDTALADGAAGGEKKGLPIKWIALAFIVLILVGAAGVVLKSGILSSSSSEEGTPEAADTAGVPETEIGPIYPLETFIVNLADARGKKYLKTKLELELDNPLVVGEIDQRLPQFRDTILTILSSKTFDDVRQLEGKFQLRAEVMTMLNQFLKSGKITNVYFTEFIVQ